MSPSLEQKLKLGESIFRQVVAGNYTKDRISKALAQLFDITGDEQESYLMPLSGSWHEVDRHRALYASLFVRNANVLLIGSYGTGKTYSAKVLSRLSGLNLVRVQGEIDKDKGLFAGVIDTGKMLSQKQLDIVFPDYADKPEESVLFIDEINRFSPYEQSFLTSILAERLMDVEIKSNEFKRKTGLSKDGLMKSLDGLTVFATRNREDSATFSMPYHLLDRFHISVAMDTDPTCVKEATDTANKILKSILSPEEIRQARQQVQSVRISPEVHTYLVAMMLQLQCGVFGAQKEFCGADMCSGCGQNADVCSYVSHDFVPSARSKVQILDYARANAFLDGRNEVNIEKDVLPYVFMNLAHKIRLRPDAVQRLANSANMKVYAPTSLDRVGNLPIFDVAWTLIKASHSKVMDVLPKLENVRKMVNVSVLGSNSKNPEQIKQELKELLNSMFNIDGIRNAGISKWVLGRIDYTIEIIKELYEAKSGIREKELISPVAENIIRATKKDRSRNKEKKKERENEENTMSVAMER